MKNTLIEPSVVRAAMEQFDVTDLSLIHIFSCTLQVSFRYFMSSVGRRGEMKSGRN